MYERSEANIYINMTLLKLFGKIQLNRTRESSSSFFPSSIFHEFQSKNSLLLDQSDSWIPHDTLGTYTY